MVEISYFVSSMMAMIPIDRFLFLQVMKKAASPTKEWGPALPENRTGRYAWGSTPNPEQNGFVPDTTLSVIKLTSEKTDQMYDNEGFRMWHSIYEITF